MFTNNQKKQKIKLTGISDFKLTSLLNCAAPSGNESPFATSANTGKGKVVIDPTVETIANAENA